MNLSKFNFVQALGSIIAIVIYIIGPVVGVSVPVVGVSVVGVSGSIAMRIDFVFVIPIILMGIALLVSIMPLGKLSSIAGAVAGIGTLIIGLCGGGVLVGFIKRVGTLAATLIPGLSDLGSLDNLDVVSSFFLNIGWGALVAALIMIVTAIAGIFAMIIMEGNSGNRTVAGGGRVGQSTVPGVTRGKAVNNLYRHK